MTEFTSFVAVDSAPNAANTCAREAETEPEASPETEAPPSAEADFAATATAAGGYGSRHPCRRRLRRLREPPSPPPGVCTGTKSGVEAACRLRLRLRRPRCRRRRVAPRLRCACGLSCPSRGSCSVQCRSALQHVMSRTDLLVPGCRGWGGGYGGGAPTGAYATARSSSSSRVAAPRHLWFAVFPMVLLFCV